MTRMLPASDTLYNSLNAPLYKQVSLRKNYNIDSKKRQATFC